MHSFIFDVLYASHRLMIAHGEWGDCDMRVG